MSLPAVPANTSSPADTVLLTQLSDGADYLRLVTDDLFAFTLKLNVLFFDQIALGSPDLLGNRRFYDFCIREPKAIERLFSPGPDGTTALCPTIWDHNASLVEVAEKMSAAQTITTLSSGEDLLRHARTLDALRPAFLYSKEDEYRKRYFQLTQVLLQKTLDEDDASLASFLPSKPAAQAVLKWCEAIKDASRFSCSSFYRFIDSHDFKEDGIRLKHVGDTVAHYTLSSVLDTRISVPEQISPIITALRREAPLGNADDRIEEEDISTDFPVLALGKLSLHDVLELRELGAIRETRQCLNGFRVSGNVKSSQLQKALDDASGKILDYAFRRPSDRRQFLRVEANRANHLRMRLIFNAASAVAPVALAFFAPSKPDLALLTVLQVAVYTMKTSYERWGDKVQGRNMAHIPLPEHGKEVSFQFLEGRVKNPV